MTVTVTVTVNEVIITRMSPHMATMTMDRLKTDHTARQPRLGVVSITPARAIMQVIIQSIQVRTHSTVITISILINNSVILNSSNHRTLVHRMLELHAARHLSSQDEQHQDHEPHLQPQARVNGEVHHERVPKRAVSPGQSHQADQGSVDGAEALSSSAIGQGGLVAAASMAGGAGARSGGYHGGPVVTPIDDGYGNGHTHGHVHVHAHGLGNGHGNGTDKLQTIRTGGMNKMDKVDMADDRAEETAPLTTMAPEALTAELRINERHQAFVNN
ncbi:hypothetical protein BGZ70_009995 [Mortierella alpina]|uniref:Uncharacterized protein n=1 Tax=Mortierella alpina TaxID=64518 RepID=A0A9P6J095_MORAP|nr:hypothetical protein BGZ70_009995 [Mortierella alpina]